MSLDNKSRELIALGAAIGGNCIPCLKWHIKQGTKLGSPVEDIKWRHGVRGRLSWKQITKKDKT